MSEWSAPDAQPYGSGPPSVAPSHLVAEPMLADVPADAARQASRSVSSGSGVGTYMAMPRLMGGPAYARPPRPLVEATPRPFDPDDLPLEAWQSDEERQLADAAAMAWQQGREAAARGPVLQPSSSGGLRGIAARLLRAGS